MMAVTAVLVVGAVAPRLRLLVQIARGGGGQRQDGRQPLLLLEVAAQRGQCRERDDRRVHEPHARSSASTRSTCASVAVRPPSLSMTCVARRTLASSGY